MTIETDISLRHTTNYGAFMLISCAQPLCIGTLLVCLTAFQPVWANDAELMQEEPSTGSSIKKKLVSGGRVPIRQNYEQLSEEHRAYYRSFYNNMPATDEPPFPREGLISIFKPISKVQGSMPVEGDVEMYVTVNSNGHPVKVSVYKTPDPKTTEEIAKVLMLTDFKPAVCAGKPCVMEFPFVVTLRKF